MKWIVKYDCPEPYWELTHKIKDTHIVITIEPRPAYCDRGNYIAKIICPGGWYIDSADCWPRYYFEESVAKSECEAWIEKRQELEQR